MGLGTFSCLLITFANSLDPDQARQIVGPDLDPNCLSLMAFQKELIEKVKKNNPSMQRVNMLSWAELSQ